MRFVTLFSLLAILACDRSVIAVNDTRLASDVSVDVQDVDNSVYACESTSVVEEGQPKFHFVLKDGVPVLRCGRGCDQDKCLIPTKCADGCDDGIPCTEDTCVNDLCVYTPRSQLCARDGDVCVPEYAGCVQGCNQSFDCDLDFGHECLDQPGGASYMKEEVVMVCIQGHCLQRLTLENCAEGQACAMTAERCVVP